MLLNLDETNCVHGKVFVGLVDLGRSCSGFELGIKSSELAHDVLVCSSEFPSLCAKIRLTEVAIQIGLSSIDVC